jgi:CheY-like chemotaxis protein
VKPRSPTEETEANNPFSPEDLLLDTPNLEAEISGEFSGATADALHSKHLVSLLCMDQEATLKILKSLLERMGYMTHCPPTLDSALRSLRFNQYRLIVLGDAFDGRAPNPVTSYLANLNMNIRRDIFVVLLGARFKTEDYWQAFVDSVDLVYHPDDILRLPTCLEQSLKKHERLYSVFNECLKEAGKKI